jgi:FMN reductase [NAD(P)H]
MNEIVRLLQSHRSERSYKSDPIPDEILDDIIESAHRAPTSMNTQQISVVVIKDAARRKRISEIVGGQAYVAQAPVFLTLVADLYKTRIGAEIAGLTQQIQHSLESVVTTSTDAGIALATILISAHSYGLGAVPIGSIRRDPFAMIELLGLPEYTFPVVGVALGYVDKPANQKPRLPIESFRHEERYHAENVRPAIDAYEISLPEHWKKVGLVDEVRWSQKTGKAYSQVYFSKVKAAAAKQGFTCED